MKCINQTNILQFVRKVRSNRALNALIHASSSCIKYPKFDYAGRNHIIEGQKQLQSISDFFNGIQAIYRGEYATLSICATCVELLHVEPIVRYRCQNLQFVRVLVCSSFTSK